MGVVLPFDPAVGLLVPGGPQTRNPRYFAVPQGLAAYHSFDPDSLDIAGNFGADLSGNAVNATLTNFVAADVLDGQVGQSLNWSNANRVYSLGNTLPSQTNMTFAFWIKRASGTAGDAFVMTKGTFGGNYEYGIYYDKTNGGWTIFGNANSNSRFASSTEGTSTDWKFKAFTKAGTTWTHYDNAVAGTTVIITAASGTGVNTVIGALQGNAGFTWQGRVDDMRVYNRALDPGEVQQLYQAGLFGRRDAMWALPGECEMPMLQGDNVIVLLPGTRHQRQSHGATTRCRAQRRAGARCRRRRRWANGAAHEE